MELFKRVSILAVCLCLSVGVFSQDQTEALDILQKTRAKVEAQKIVEISFDYEVSYAEKEEVEKYSGKFLAKGNKYKLEIDNTITYCDGKTKWVYLVESNEVNISNVEKIDDMELEEQFLNDPLSIFSLYEKDFKYFLKGTVDYNGKNVWEIDFLPNDREKPYFKVRSWILSDYNLVALRYFQKDGTRVTMNITESVLGTKYKESEFVFNISAHEGVEVIDLR